MGLERSRTRSIGLAGTWMPGEHSEHVLERFELMKGLKLMFIIVNCLTDQYCCYWDGLNWTEVREQAKIFSELEATMIILNRSKDQSNIFMEEINGKS